MYMIHFLHFLGSVLAPVAFSQILFGMMTAGLKILLGLEHFFI